MRKAVTEFELISNSKINNTLFQLELQSETPLLPIVPGQFANMEIPVNRQVFLRRPFSFFQTDYDRNRVVMLVKVLGKGSKTLSELPPGQSISMVYPLGKGFTLPEKGDKVLAVGGGSGIAPILFLAGESGLTPDEMFVLIGAKTKSEIFPAESYSNCATCLYSTEDGTFGESGMVTGHPVFELISQFTRIYACGPLPMMKAIAAIANRAGIKCEVSLENLMACGYGVCLCCIEPTVNGNLSVCTEGPVFNTNDLLW